MVLQHPASGLNNKLTNDTIALLVFISLVFTIQKWDGPASIFQRIPRVGIRKWIKIQIDHDWSYTFTWWNWSHYFATITCPFGDVKWNFSQTEFPAIEMSVSLLLPHLVNTLNSHQRGSFYSPWRLNCFSVKFINNIERSYIQEVYNLVRSALNIIK